MADPQTVELPASNPVLDEIAEETGLPKEEIIRTALQVLSAGLRSGRTLEEMREEGD